MKILGRSALEVGIPTGRLQSHRAAPSLIYNIAAMHTNYKSYSYKVSPIQWHFLTNCISLNMWHA